MGFLIDLLAELFGRKKPPKPVPVPPSMTLGEARDWVAGLLNAERAKRGLRPYLRLATLDAFAQEWAEGTQVTTSNPHGNHIQGVFHRFPDAMDAAEIIAPRFATPEAAVNAWMNESGLVQPHRAEILSHTHTHMGIGVADHAGQRYWVVCLLAFRGAQP